MKKIKILIITAPYGSGHLQVSKSILEEFNKRKDIKLEVEIFDVYTSAGKIRTNLIKKIYLCSYKNKILGKIYASSFYNMKKNLNSKFKSKLFKFGTKAFEKKVSEFNPNIIINTFSFHPAYAFSKNNPDISLYTIITDYYANYMWISEYNKITFVASEEVKKMLLKEGIDKSKICISGIPVSDKFYNRTFNRSELLKNHRLVGDKPVVFIFTGAYGVLPKITKIIKSLCSKNFQVMLVCGKNKKLYKKTSKLAKKISNLKVYGFVNDIDEKMELADVMITKAGGIIITEAINKNIPMVLFSPAKGQEAENALLLKNRNIALIAKKTIEVAEKTAFILDEIDRNYEMAVETEKLVIKNSATKITNEIVQDFIRRQ